MSLEGKLPVHDEHSECAVLALVLCRLVSVSQVQDLLPDPEAFFGGSHQSIWRAVLKVFAAGTEPDTVSVATALREASRLSEVGGVVYLTGLLELVGDSINERNARDYAETVRRCWQQRKAALVTHRLLAHAYESSPSFTEKLAESIGELQGIEQGFSVTSGSLSAKDVVVAMAHEQRGAQDGILSGLFQLDEITRGIKRKEVCIIGARTSVGKSALAIQLARMAAMNGHPVFYVTLEMTAKAIVTRMISSASEVDARKYDNRSMDIEESRRWLAASLEISKLPFKANVNQSMSFAEILKEVQGYSDHLRQAKRRLGLVVVDHVGLVRPSQSKQNREQQVAEVSRGLRYLADRFDCAVIGLAQINRDAEKRQGAERMPKLYDLRESGSIEQDSDTVLLLHRERDSAGMFKRDVPAQLVVAKARISGVLGLVSLKFEDHLVRFSPWS